MKKPQHAVGYARQSADDEDGIERQVESMEQWAANEGWVIAEWVTENDTSANMRKPRPEYERTLQRLEAGEFDGLLCKKPERLIRHPTELEHFIDVVGVDRRNIIPVASVNSGKYELSTAVGRLVARNLGSVARYELELMIERLQDAEIQRAKRGLPSGGGRRPFGFGRPGHSPTAEDKCVVYEPEARVVRMAADLVLAGQPIRAVARAMNETGILGTTGAPWSNSKVRQLLLSPRYAGLREHRPVDLKGKRSKEGDLYPAAWPAIIDHDKWLAVRTVLTAPGRSPLHNGASARVALLVGFVRCEACGHTLRNQAARPKESKRRRYACSKDDGCGVTGIDADKLDDLIVRSILLRLDGAEIPTPDVTNDTPVSDVAELEARKAELAEMYAAGDVDKASWRVALDGIERRLAEAHTQLAEQFTTAATATLLDRRVTAVEWDGMTFDQKRTVVATLIDHIDILPFDPSKPPRFDKERVRIEWKV